MIEKNHIKYDDKKSYKIDNLTDYTMLQTSRKHFFVLKYSTAGGQLFQNLQSYLVKYQIHIRFL
jgi:hypothetical protein